LGVVYAFVLFSTNPVRVNASNFVVFNIVSSLIFACQCNMQYRLLSDTAFSAKFPRLNNI
jgi:hypothetical protein